MKFQMKLPKYALPISVLGTSIGCIVLMRDSLAGCRYRGEEKIFGRTVIITGATSGLGKALAGEMAERGGRIIMASRDMKKCEQVRTTIIEETHNKNIHCKFCDLSSLRSVRAFAKDINENEKRIDVLVNNAGIMKNQRAVTEDGFEEHLGVNHLGHFLLTNLLLDKLKTSAPSRVVNVTTLAHQKGYIDFKDLNASKEYYAKQAYSQSKLANVLFTTELAKRMEGTNVSVYAVHPGLVLTNLGREFGMNKSVMSSVILRPLWWLLFKNPEQGIQPILQCALGPDVQNGKFYKECDVCKLVDDAANPEVAKRLWLISERWTKLNLAPS